MTHNSPISIQTPRLHLLPCTVELMQQIFEQKSAIQMADGIPSPDMVDILPKFIHKLASNPSSLGWWVWLMLHPTAGAIGDIGFGGPPNDDGIVEIGYEVSPTYRRCGYGFEAARALTDWAFERPQLQVITAYCPEDNTPSKRILEKLGMQRQYVVDMPQLPDREVWKWQIER
ncbi:MAG: GNAT family N-acetyltransferase [Cyanobacteriota bacterium]|nr:GNAT family N-acetyltransferase [Cyanobacteriota bacterium]